MQEPAINDAPIRPTTGSSVSSNAASAQAESDSAKPFTADVVERAFGTIAVKYFRAPENSQFEFTTKWTPGPLYPDWDADYYRVTFEILGDSDLEGKNVNAGKLWIQKLGWVGNSRQEKEGKYRSEARTNKKFNWPGQLTINLIIEHASTFSTMRSIAPLDIETRPYYRKWMIDFYPLEVTAENKKFYFQNGTFDNYLGRNLVDDWDNSANRGGYNAGVYTFTGPKRTYLGGHPPNQLVVKVLRQDQLDKWAYGEVMALELAGLYVASGKKSKNQIFAVFMKNRKSRPAIIMKKVQGMSLLKTTVWRRADPAMKISLKNAVKEIIKVQVVDFAVQHGILHNDFHTGNVFVDLSQDGTVRGAKLIDYGYPGMISIRSTNRKVLEKYFEWRWAKLWDGT
ncbi:MAG: hypothetical protein NXY57DRAFT_1039640 [Lentinula lateritia]|nr:MAG: hypothetical protein NXY57DRAFT_1039640 [Lentinula lateritia]